MLNKKLVLLIFLVFFYALTGLTAQSAQTTPPTAPANTLVEHPELVLGMDLASAYKEFGPPNTVAVVRGKENFADDVVFNFANGVNLYWAGNKVWQIYCTKPYNNAIYGIMIGDSVEKVASVLGAPFFSQDTTVLYRLSYKAFPLRLRLIFTAGKVSDLYLYRADY